VIYIVFRKNIVWAVTFFYVERIYSSVWKYVRFQLEYKLENALEKEKTRQKNMHIYFCFILSRKSRALDCLDILYDRQI
jgi:hypothetical protein